MQVVLGAIALAGVVVTLGSLLWLHVMPTGLNPVSAAVSQYGISSYRGGYRTATIALGVAAIALGLGLTTALTPPNTVAFVFLLIFGVARLVISWAPMDAPGSPRTGRGRSHNILATLFFASATIAAFLYSGSFSASESFGSIAVVSSALAWAMAATSVLILLATFAVLVKRFFGLIERLLYLAVLAWMTVVSVAVIAIG